MKKIPLIGVHGAGKVALVDDSDYEWLNQWSWCYSGRYVMHWTRDTQGRRYSVSMHRTLMGAPRKFEIDHIDGDPLNNQRANLRLATRSENEANVRRTQGFSEYRGVFREKRGAPWRVRIRTKEGRISWGKYYSEEDAARGYNEAALKYHGRFARLNEI